MWCHVVPCGLKDLSMQALKNKNGQRFDGETMFIMINSA